MFKNYLKVALRNLLRNKGFTLINVSGLVVGMTCAILILLYVQFELSYDKFHQNAENIYRIAWMSDRPQTRTPHPMAQAMVKDFPEVVQAVTLSPLWGPGLTRPKLSVRYEEKRFDEPGFFSADSTFLKVFSFNLIQGDAKTALRETGGVIITEEIAQKYFGQEGALGKTLILDVGQEFPMKVTGVIENIPANSHFKFDFLLSYVTLKPLNDGEYYTWADFGHFNYIMLKDGSDPKTLEAKIPDWVQTYLNLPEEVFNRLKNGEVRFALQPITNIHLHSNLKWELEANSSITNVYLFSSAALFILLIACINFMSLSTARSANRAKEVGVRKVVGSNRTQLVKQFLGESFLLAIISILITIAMVELLLPYFNGLTGKALDFNLFGDPGIFARIIAITVFVAILSGSYPAFFLSAFKPIVVLRGKIQTGMKSIIFRRTMVVLQFAISIALIAGTGIVASQLNFLQSKNLGFDKEQIVVLPMRDPAMRPQYESIKNEILRDSDILHASAVSNVPGSRFNQNPINWEPDAQNRNVQASEIRVDFDFFKTLGIEIKQGRSFSKEFSTDLEHSFILNETAARQFQWDSPLNKEIVWFDDEVTRRGEVIGVAGDFHFQSLHKSIEPLIFQVLPDEFNYMLVKIATNNLVRTLTVLENKWAEFDPGHTFEYSFLNDDFDKLYRSEESMQKIFGHFTVLAIFVAGLGLFGLMTFSVQQRFKEIGIRKVLGASLPGIVTLLSREYLRLVLLANIIAWPIAYLTMNNWLQEFAYRTNINWLIFVLAGGLALLIAFVTVSWQAIRAALANPVDSLRYE